MHIREFIEKNYPEYYSIERYPADKTAAFCKVDAPWGIFSNFGRTPLVVDDVPFDCSEKLFQVMKFSDTKSRKAVFVAKGQTMKMKAKHQEKVGTVRFDWGEIIVDAMKFCLTQKYAQSGLSVRNWSSAAAFSSWKTRLPSKRRIPTPGGRSYQPTGPSLRDRT